MLKKIHLSFLMILLSVYVSFSQNFNSLNLERIIPHDSIYFIQIKTDSLFNSKQIISVLAINKKPSGTFRFEIGYGGTELKTTSAFAKDRGAAAAINAGFFDMDKGGSVSYFEINDTVINRTRPARLKWAKPHSLFNGAIVISKNGNIHIESAGTEGYYEHSRKEAAVLLSGPLLLLNGEKIKLQQTEFVKKRHPRTFFCTTNEFAVFITVDGRSREAEGMNLIEAQQFLQSIGCLDAINLDGGGSTTLWIKEKGVVNFPSDLTGERPVANVLLILKNQ